VNTLEEIATAKNPAWREPFRKQGRRFHQKCGGKLEPLSAWETEGRAFIEHLLRDLLDTKRDRSPMCEVQRRILNQLKMIHRPTELREIHTVDRV
jgi:hypothetical protein